MDKARQYKIDRYIDRVWSNDDPVSIQAGIIDSCFNKCPMCDHPTREQFIIRADRWLRFLGEHSGIESVCYSGGDTLSHPELNDIMRGHLDLGISFGFITSGYIPPKVDLDLLREARWLRVSLDTIDPEVYKKVRGGISLSVVLKSLERMKDHGGINVEMTLTVGHDSAPSLPNTLRWIRDNGYDADMHTQYGLTWEELEPLSTYYPLDSFVHMADQKGVTLAPFDMGNPEEVQCTAVYYQSYIDSKGDIFPCCTMAGDTEAEGKMWPLGNIDNWAEYLRERLKFSRLSSKERPSSCQFCYERFCLINSRVATKQLETRNSFF